MKLILILSILTQSELNAKSLSMGGCFVSLADDPSALYYNPAGLTNLKGKELLFSMKSPFDYLFFGYGQEIEKEMIIGIGAYKGNGILIGVEKDISFLSIGMGIGLEREEKYYPSVSMGLLLSPLWFKDVPGNICSGLSLFYSGSLIFRWGLKYEYEPVKVLFEIDSPLSFHIGASYPLTLKEWLPQIDIMAGFAYEERFYPSFGLGLDLQEIQLNMGYRIGEGFILSAKFQIGERMERIVELYAQFREKMYSTSNTLLNQGKELYNQEKYEEALHAFDLALIWDPTNKEAQNWYNQAEEKKKSEKKKDESVFEKIKRYEKEKRWKKALWECNRSLKLTPEDERLLKEREYILKEIRKVANYHLQLGIARFKREALAEAEKEFERVLLYQPKNSKAKAYINKIHKRRKQADPYKLYLAGIEAYTRGEYELSIKLWERVLEIQSGYPNAKNNIERAKRKLKLIEER